MFVFNMIRSSLMGLRSYIGAILQTNDVFVKSLNQIKSNLMTAFYPIYQYILPALNALMGTLVRASAYLAQFVSMLFGKTFEQSKSGAKALAVQTAALNKQAKGYEKVGKSAKKAAGELASFDKIEVLNMEKQSKLSTPKAQESGFVFSPTTFEDFSNMSSVFDVVREKISPTIKVFEKLEKTISKTFGGFAVQTGKDFYHEFLKPLGNWTLGRGFPEFARITENMFKNINFIRLNQSLKELFKVLEPFSEHIGEGLLWFYKNVLTPIGTWTFNEVLPRALTSIKGSIKAIDNVLDGASDTFRWFFNDVVKNLASFTGDKFLSFWDKLNTKIEAVGDTVDWKNPGSKLD
jgi:hypothetical protein